MMAKRSLTQRYVSYAIAALLVASGVLGLLHNSGYLFAALSRGLDQPQDIADLPHFYTAFYVMSAISIGCYLAIIAASVGLCLGSAISARLLTGLLLFEVLYFFAIGAMWKLPSVGLGIAAATGIANGGLMFQFLLLMPIWIPIVFTWLGLYRDNSEVAVNDVPTEIAKSRVV